MELLNKIFFKWKIFPFLFETKNNEVKFYDDYQNNINKNLKKNFFISKKKIYKFKFDYIVISPGINIDKCTLKSFLKKNRNKIYTDLDIFYSHYSKNVIIAITGTNGKSTTAKLLSEIINKNKRDSRLVGNIGKSILREKKISKKTIFVVEASSYQIEYSKIFKPNYAILLNISPDHLERHKTFKNYLNAKLKLFYSQKKNDFSFFNRKKILTLKGFKRVKIKSKIINVKDNLNYKDKQYIKNNYFNNRNNQQNLSFIFSICKKLKINKNYIFKVVNNFKKLFITQKN